MSTKHTPGPLAFDVEDGECSIFSVKDSEVTVAELWDVTDARLLAAAYTSYDKHCGPRAVECAEGDLLGRCREDLKFILDCLEEGEDVDISRIRNTLRCFAAKAGSTVVTQHVCDYRCSGDNGHHAWPSPEVK